MAVISSARKSLFQICFLFLFIPSIYIFFLLHESLYIGTFSVFSLGDENLQETFVFTLVTLSNSRVSKQGLHL